MFNPFDHYWLADDGRVYSSKAQSLVPEVDPDWATGNAPTPWPRDMDGNQSDAELQRVMFPYRVAVDMKAYAFMLRDQKEHGGCAITDVAGIIEIRTDLYTQNLISRYHEAAAGNLSFSVPWVLPDRSTVTLDKAAIDKLFDQMTAFIVGTYTTYSQVIEDVDGGAITTSDQVDQAFESAPLVQGTPPPDIGWKS
jgi:hypothetical protein